MYILWSILSKKFHINVLIGIILSCSLAGLFFRPLEPTLVTTEDDEEGDEKRELNENQIPLMGSKGKVMEMTKSSSFACMPENGRFVK